MSIDFTCPHCGESSQVDDRHAGFNGPCLHCGKLIAVPNEDGALTARAGSRGLGPLLMAVIVVVGLLILLLWPALMTPRVPYRIGRCTNNMRQIGLALLLYEQVHGTLPPAYIADENGKPMHSWRVLILPYIEENLLYEQYDFSQPWDSEANLQVAEQMPSVYRCPSSDVRDQLNYMVISGPGTAFPGSRGVLRKEVTDDPGQTLLLVEVAGSKAGWTEPVDLPAASMSWQINGAAGNSISSEHEGIVNAVFLDGSSVRLDEDTPAATLRALSTIAGGEDVNL